MDKDNMKNMIVLKNLPSNIVDEAIVILKPNVKLKSLDLADNKNTNNKKTDIEKNKKQSKGETKKYIINEAQMVITNYLSKIENDNKNKIKANKIMETKYKRLKAISIFLGIMFLGSFLIK